MGSHIASLILAAVEVGITLYLVTTTTVYLAQLPFSTIAVALAEDSTGIGSHIALVACRTLAVSFTFHGQTLAVLADLPFFALITAGTVGYARIIFQTALLGASAMSIDFALYLITLAALSVTQLLFTAIALFFTAQAALMEVGIANFALGTVTVGFTLHWVTLVLGSVAQLFFLAVGLSLTVRYT